MRLRTLGFIVTLAMGLLVVPLAVEAQRAGKVYRIGVLGNTPPATSPETLRIWEAFLQGLRERDWVEGQNIVFERRFAEGRAERFPDLAAELVRLKVDIIVASATPGSLAAKRATTTIPIVMAVIYDPVGSGLVASLARPGGNVTGVSWLGPELSAKRLELLKEAVPVISRVAVLWNPSNPAQTLAVRDMQTVAPRLGVTLQFREVRSPNDFDSAFTAMTRNRPDALFTASDPLNFVERTRILEFAAKSRLPAIYDWREFVDLGGLMAYGANLSDLYRTVATYVDKILKGAKPADLPVEQPTKFELVINLKTAKALGLTIPPSVLIRADQVIE